MPRLKCVRYETFARKYVILGSIAEAYRQTRREMRLPPNLHPASARTWGYHIFHRPEVQRRVSELQDRQMKKADITMDRQLTELENALTFAKAKGDSNAMVKCIESQSKHVGLLRERVEQGHVGEFDGTEQVSEILQKIADEISPEAALKLAEAAGLEVAEAENEQTAELLNKAPPTDSVN